MDPSSAPWRAFESVEPPISGANGGAPPARSAPTDAAQPIPRPLLLGAIAAIGVLVVSAALLLTGGEPGQSSVAVGSETGASVAPATVGGPLVVDVGGAVLHPGVYHLASGSRVGDAITAAGGFGPRVDATQAAALLNLAAIVQDGQRVTVPSRDDVAGGRGGPASTGGPGKGALVDLNHASEAELEALPGIGPATAAKIIASRETTPFAAIGELRDRKLVGQKAYDGLKDLVTIH